MPTESLSFVDSYQTDIYVRLKDGHDHVQLLMRWPDGSEPFSYGFTKDDFQRFAKVVSEVAEAVR